MPGCTLCPRRCGKPRTPDSPGFCGASEPPGSYGVARLLVHRGEEPCISGIRGSRTVFFRGCSLRCSYCQNHEISLSGHGQTVTEAELLKDMLALAATGVHNINLVTPSHYADRLPAFLQDLRQALGRTGMRLPVIWNSSGYETPESLWGLAGVVDIFMPDMKFFDTALSSAVCGAPDYFGVASRAILTMRDLAPDIIFGNGELLEKGLLIRHLVLPGHRRDSCRILDFLADSLPPDTPLSLMSQFTPQPDLQQPAGFPELNRRLTTLEYDKVVDYAVQKGFRRLTVQDRSSASCAYTPDFRSF